MDILYEKSFIAQALLQGITFSVGLKIFFSALASNAKKTLHRQIFINIVQERSNGIIHALYLISIHPYISLQPDQTVQGLLRSNPLNSSSSFSQPSHSFTKLNRNQIEPLTLSRGTGGRGGGGFLSFNSCLFPFIHPFVHLCI